MDAALTSAKFTLMAYNEMRLASIKRRHSSNNNNNTSAAAAAAPATKTCKTFRLNEKRKLLMILGIKSAKLIESVFYL